MECNLRTWANQAIIAFGHGTVWRDDGATVEIGGSTGGMTRRLLDDYEEPDAERFLSQLP